MDWAKLENGIPGNLVSDLIFWLVMVILLPWVWTKFFSDWWARRSQSGAKKGIDRLLKDYERRRKIASDVPMLITNFAGMIFQSLGLIAVTAGFLLLVTLGWMIRPQHQDGRALLVGFLFLMATVFALAQFLRETERLRNIAFRSRKYKNKLFRDLDKLAKKAYPNEEEHRKFLDDLSKRGIEPSDEPDDPDPSRLW
jgi:hypothetical protein